MRSSQILSNKDMDSIQQPLDYKTGYENERFTKLYGKKKNPVSGTERDAKNRNRFTSVTYPEKSVCPKCGGNKFVYQEVCYKCL